MKKRIIFAGLLLLCSFKAEAFWVWTPESNQWTNPKYSVKETPQEQLKYSIEFFDAGDTAKAIQEFRKLIKSFPRAREAADAQYYVGRCLEKDGQFLKAFQAYQVVIDKYPYSERGVEIIEQQFEIGNDLLEGKDTRNKFIKTVVGGDYDVVEIFRTVIKNAPYGKFAAQAQYKIGLYLQEKQLFQEARDEFEKTMNDYPESEWAKAAKYQIALSDSSRSSHAQYDQKVTKSAIDEFETFVKENPQAELSGKAKDQIHQLREKEAENNFLVAAFYEKNKKYQAAKLYYSTIVDDYRNTTWAPKALAKLREMNTLQK